VANQEILKRRRGRQRISSVVI